MHSRLRFIFGDCLLLVAAACAPNRAVTPSYQAVTSVDITAGRAFDNYEPVPQEAAAILGCDRAPNLPICLVTIPSSEEDSAFRSEGARLREHGEAKCRELGEAILANSERVKMYPKALVVESGNGRLYGVGHTYELGDSWMIRVARRIDDLNDRSLEEKKRTLRHEMSHTIGAQESGSAWTAEDYAVRCG